MIRGLIDPSSRSSVFRAGLEDSRAIERGVGCRVADVPTGTQQQVLDLNAEPINDANTTLTLDAGDDDQGGDWLNHNVETSTELVELMMARRLHDAKLSALRVRSPRMRDQAMWLRQLALDLGQELEAVVGKPVYVIGSGKGGVGKSIVATLMAQAFAERGARVLLVDGSQNLGHLHIMLGIVIDARLEHVLNGEVEPASLVRPISNNLWLLPSDSGAESLYALPAVDQARLHHRLAALYDDFDVVVVDAGPGVETAVRLATMGGSRLIVVTVPEIAALTDAYALIKLVHAQLPTLPIDVLVNRAVDSADAAGAFERLAVAAERFLGKILTPIGGLSEAAALRDAMRRPGGLLIDASLAGLRGEIQAVLNSLPRETPAASPRFPTESSPA